MALYTGTQVPLMVLNTWLEAQFHISSMLDCCTQASKPELSIFLYSTKDSKKPLTAPVPDRALEEGKVKDKAEREAETLAALVVGLHSSQGWIRAKHWQNWGLLHNY